MRRHGAGAAPRGPHPQRRGVRRHPPLADGQGLRGDVHPQRHGHRRQDHRERRARRHPVLGRRHAQRTRVRPGLRHAGLPPADLRAPGHRARAGDDRAHAAPDRRRARVRRGRRRLLRRPRVPRVRRPERPAHRRDAAGGGLRRHGQARLPRLRHVEGGQAGRALVGHALGPGPAGLAPRVLGDGGEVPRRRSSTSTAAGSTSSSRTTRTRSPSRRRPATPSPTTGCTTPGSPRRARR